MEPPIPLDETVRLKSLQSLKILDTQPEERFDRITRLARSIFGVPISLVSLVDSDRQWFKSRSGLDADETPRGISFCGHAIQGSDVFVVQNACGDERFCDNPLVVGEPQIRFYAGYPLHAPDGSRLGTLCIIDREPREFGAEEAETLTHLGQMVEAELFTATLATTDELTGLSNRRGFQAIAEHALALCRRNELAATLMLFDLNDFKRINDDLGHDEGDRALRQFSRCLVRSCRGSDIVARLGGDEFCGLFAGSCVDDIEPVVERLEQIVNATNEQRPAEYPIRYSVGSVAADAEADLAMLLRAADEAMYRQKRGERRAG